MQAGGIVQKAIGCLPDFLFFCYFRQSLWFEGQHPLTFLEPRGAVPLLPVGCDVDKFVSDRLPLQRAPSMKAVFDVMRPPVVQTFRVFCAFF